MLAIIALHKLYVAVFPLACLKNDDCCHNFRVKMYQFSAEFDCCHSVTGFQMADGVVDMNDVPWEFTVICLTVCYRTFPCATRIDEYRLTGSLLSSYIMNMTFVEVRNSANQVRSFLMLWVRAVVPVAGQALNVSSILFRKNLAGGQH